MRSFNIVNILIVFGSLTDLLSVFCSLSSSYIHTVYSEKHNGLIFLDIKLSVTYTSKYTENTNSDPAPLSFPPGSQGEDGAPGPASCCERSTAGQD